MRVVDVIPRLPDNQCLGKVGRSVLLVGGNDLAGLDLLVGVGGPDNQLLGLVDNGQSGEALVGAELAAPAGGDGVGTALGRATVALRSLGALDGKSAGGRLGAGDASVDTEGPVALGVGGVADTLEVLDGPLRDGGHHGDAARGRSRGGEGAVGSEESSDEDVGELHVCG